MYELSAKENLVCALTRRDPEYVPFRRMDGHIPGLVNILYHGSTAPLNGTDRWGVTWSGGIPARSEWEPEVMSYPTYHPLSDLDRLNDYPFPDPQEPGLMDGLLQDVDRSRVIVSARQNFLLLERAHLLMGMENLMVAMLLDQDRAQDLLHRIADYQIGIIQRYLALDVDIIRATDDYGGQDRLLISPALWRRLIKPELARIVRAVKEGGAMFWLHSCGHIMEILPDLVEIGVDVLDPIQATANDVVEVKRLYRDKLSFMGGMDVQHMMTRASPAEVTAAVRTSMAIMAPGAGYVMGPDNIIPVPEENYRAYLEACQRFGRYPIDLDPAA
jgi:uroporphyrinogen decarboxylase